MGQNPFQNYDRYPVNLPDYDGLTTDGEALNRRLEELGRTLFVGKGEEVDVNIIDFTHNENGQVKIRNFTCSDDGELEGCLTSGWQDAGSKGRTRVMYVYVSIIPCLRSWRCVSNLTCLLKNCSMYSIVTRPTRKQRT
jgi:hypothetical protein